MKITKISDSEYRFDVGCMWEGGPWTIELNCECSEYGGEPCEHCQDVHVKTHVRHHDKSEYIEKVWTCPRVVVATNEGGHDSTGVCLDCILEAAEELEKCR